MFRRVAAVAAAAVLTLGAGAAAAAAPTYPASDYTVTCSTQRIPVTNTFTCEIKGPDGASAQLQTTFAGEDANIIAGTVTSSAKTITGGVASYTVEAPTVTGDIEINGIVDGVTIPGEDINVEVIAELPQTGFDNWGLVISAAVLVTGGAVIVVVARRRSHQDA